MSTVYRRGRIKAEDGAVVVDECTAADEKDAAALESDGYQAVSLDEAAAAVRPVASADESESDTTTRGGHSARKKK